MDEHFTCDATLVYDCSQLGKQTVKQEYTKSQEQVASQASDYL